MKLLHADQCGIQSFFELLELRATKISKLIVRDNELETIDNLDKFGQYLTLLDVRQNNFAFEQRYDIRCALPHIKQVRYTAFDKSKSLN